MFFKIGVRKFTGKHLCLRLFLIKLQPLRPFTLLKRDSNRGIFLWNLQKFFTEHLRWLHLEGEGVVLTLHPAKDVIYVSETKFFFLIQEMRH